MPFPRDLESVQWAREAVKGTDLATTSIMIVERFNPVPSTPDAFRPEFARGLVLANRGGETVINRGTQWTAEGPFTYEQAQNLFSGAIENDAAPTGLGPYVWTHTRNPAAIPDLASYTFERNIDDGGVVGPIGHAWHYAMIETLELTFPLNEVVRFNASGFARRQQDETLTAAQTLPTHEIVKSPTLKVYMDGSWATIGSTQLTAQVLSGSLRIGSGAGPLWTADGRSDLDFVVEAYASSRVTCELDLTMLIGADYAAEKTAAEAQTLRAVRLEFTGTGNNVMHVDMLLKHKVPELFAFDYNDEQVITTWSLVGSTDGTNAWEAVVTNDVSAYA